MFFFRIMLNIEISIQNICVFINDLMINKMWKQVFKKAIEKYDIESFFVNIWR